MTEASIIGTMKGQDPKFTLLEAARIVARGNELDAKLALDDTQEGGPRNDDQT